MKHEAMVDDVTKGQADASVDEQGYGLVCEVILLFAKALDFAIAFLAKAVQ